MQSDSKKKLYNLKKRSIIDKKIIINYKGRSFPWNLKSNRKKCKKTKRLKIFMKIGTVNMKG